MRRNKAFAAAGLLTLALGIGATTAVFSVVEDLLDEGRQPTSEDSDFHAAEPSSIAVVESSGPATPG
jgi:hypothetical protein